MMSKFLFDLKSEIKKCEANIYSIAEYKDGRVESLQLQEANPCQDLYSVAKAFVVTAIGMLCDRGLLRTDEIITDILGDECPADCEKVWYRTTVDMLLLHKVALPGGFLDIDCIDANEFGEDYLAYIMTYKSGFEGDIPEPVYTDAAYYMLSRIVEKRAGMGTDTFLWKNLFYPLGFREAAWSRCPMGHVMGATGLYLRAEDTVKLGAVYLGGGMWKDQRILSEEWVNTVLEKGYELKRIGSKLIYGKGGMRGQMLMIMPEQNRAAAYTGCGGHSFVSFIADYED